MPDILQDFLDNLDVYFRPRPEACEVCGRVGDYRCATYRCRPDGSCTP